MANTTQCQQLAQDVSSAIATPEDFAAFASALADRLYESASELESAWQDKNAGKCWAKAARLLERAATVVQE